MQDDKNVNKFVYFVTLYCTNFSPSSCVTFIDLSFFSFPFLNCFLVVNEQRMFCLYIYILI